MWWVLVTIGEAYFGLGEYDEALAWLQKANALADVPDWERESTARQLASLLRLRTVRRPEFETERPIAEGVLKDFLGDEVAAASVLTGKIGPGALWWRVSRISLSHRRSSPFWPNSISCAISK